MSDVPEQNIMTSGLANTAPVFPGIGGWWYAGTEKTGWSRQGPFLTEQKAREAYAKVIHSPSAPPGRQALETSPDIIAKIFALLEMPMPDLDTIEGITIEMKAGEPVRVIITHVSVTTDGA